MSDIQDLNDRLKNVITEFCNKIGCGKCGLEWTENGQIKCSATELQGKIMDLQYKEIKK